MDEKKIKQKLTDDQLDQVAGGAQQALASVNASDQEGWLFKEDDLQLAPKKMVDSIGKGSLFNK